MLVWPAKDTDEVVTYAIDWASRLGGDTISGATFSLATAAGMTLGASDHNGKDKSWVNLSGGTNDLRGKVLCEITTDGGQTLQQTATVLIRSR